MNLEWRGELAKRIMRAASARGLNLVAEELTTQSQRLVPEDQGDLKRSVDVQHADESNLEASVAYTAPYANRVHEGVHMNFRTDKNPHAQAKFLEQPARKNKKKFGETIATQIRRGMNNG